MIEGLAITPPVLGRISIGKVVEKNGKRLPEKDDAFTVTSLVQQREGWVNHPLDAVLRKSAADTKLRAIPVRVLFADPHLSFRAEYTAFNRVNGRPVCSGDGRTCKRRTPDGLTTLPCPTPQDCAFGEVNGCKPYGRLNVQIEGQDDDLGSFIFRTTGYNSIRTLSARLAYYQALAGDALPCLPLTLKLRAKSTTQSHRSAVYFVDLVVRDGMTLEDALLQARQALQERCEAGWDQEALDKAAAAGLANGAFEDGEEEGAAVVEEFFQTDVSPGSAGGEVAAASSLGAKLAAKASPGGTH
ncbi:hypothetical protein [Thiomonas sp. FB-Cd]|uniref:recombination directionality factor n=1 Tax=Thiomonas sp. FB-Cd TaxID=1158292 RepID=UPI0004DF5D52|nr:hypothetical protein [Thiomonas sp. FB-Cd]